MELLLLIGLVGALVYALRTEARLASLEREVEWLRQVGGSESVPPEPQPEPEPRRAPAAIVRSGGAADRPARSASALLAQAPDAYREEKAEPPETPGETLGGFFERWVGGRLMIWVGGIAIAAAGVFLVSHSIQIGLITPAVQMLMAAALGFTLVAAGEVARSRPGWSADPRVSQALTGAGIFVLYAAAYGSLVVHTLIGNGTAFALMAAVTAGALFLALRHGAAAAAMGLIGGFATPILVGERSETALPLLAYLALLDIALFTLAGRRGWTWLAAAAVVASFVWSAVLLAWPPGDAVAAGVFVLAVSVGASLLRAGEGWQLDFLRPAAIGLVQLAFLAGRTDVGLPAWLLFGLLAAACFLLERRKPEFRFLPALALLLALILLAVRTAFGEPQAPALAAAVTLLFAAGSIPAIRRADPLLAALVASAAFAGPAAILRFLRPELLDRPAWGLLLALLAAGPLLIAWARRKRGSDGEGDLARAAASAAAALLLALAARDLLPSPLVAAGWLLVTLALAGAARRLRDEALALLSLLVAGLAALRIVTRVPDLWADLALSLLGIPVLAATLPKAALVLQALLLPALLFGAAAAALPPLRSRVSRLPAIFAVLFGLLCAYLLFKQAFGLASPEDFVARGFLERTVVTQFLFAAGWAICIGRLPLPLVSPERRRAVGIWLTGIAAARLVWFDMLVHNPLHEAQHVGALPVLNLLLPAYGLSAFWLYRARRGAEARPRSGLWLILSLASLVLGTILVVRQLFQGPLLDGPALSAAESYGYSLAGLVLSSALLLAGVRLPDKALRIAGLVLLTATTVKVFGFDADALDGVLRILSFLLLGIALVGIGKLYTRVLDAEARDAEGAASA